MSTKRIGLALSGGGFRATLFHLGAVRLLYEAGLLCDVQRITSVSGGSVLAAHLALNWEKYNGTPEDFDLAAAQVVRLTRADIRGRIIRRWAFAWITILPRLFKHRHWELTALLQRSYDGLFARARLSSLPSQPQLNILSTSMTTGSLCSFDRDGVCFDDLSGQRRITTNTIELAYAVAASSAFPPLFPPILIDNKTLLCDVAEFPTAQYLTDGGVHDNLGINKMLKLHAEAKDLDLIIVSDAGGNFDWAIGRSYTSVVSRNIRASDLLMRRVSLLQYDLLEARPDVLRVHIGAVVPQGDDPTVADPGSQRALRNIRTDLDAFSPKEISSLVQHGYAVARLALAERGLAIKPPRYTWSVLGQTKSSQTTRWNDKEVRQSQVRKSRLWSGGDWVSWLSTVTLVLYFAFAVAPFYIQRVQLNFLKTENQMLAVEASRYVRQSDRKSVIVFVHGLFGNVTQTWTCATTKAYWPELLSDDKAFNSFDVYAAGYSSPIASSGESLDEVAESVYLRLRDDGVLQYKHIVFVTHDFGGLVVKRLLLKNKSDIPIVQAIVNYGTPSTGSGISRMAALFSPNKQLLAIVSNGEMLDLENEWRAINPAIPVFCAYETRPTLGMMVVDQVNAEYGCRGPIFPVNSDHADLVKPCSANSDSYIVLANAIKETSGSAH